MSVGATEPSPTSTFRPTALLFDLLSFIKTKATEIGVLIGATVGYMVLPQSRNHKVMNFPSTTASPNEIRAYIVHLLTTKHDVEEGSATDVAKGWRLGRGIDFRNANQEEFCDRFGSGTGTYLFRTVRQEESEDWKQSRIGSAAYYTSIGTAVLTIFFLYCAYTSASAKDSILQITQAFLMAALSQIIYGALAPLHIRNFRLKCGGGIFLVAAFGYLVYTLHS